MKLYIMRSLRYILRILILLAIVFGLMYLTGTLNTGGGGLLKALFLSYKGAILFAVLIILAAVYPHMAFTTVSIRAGLHENRDKIIEAMDSYGYAPVRNEEGIMVFRPRSIAKKILSQWDDAITITADGSDMLVEGMKKDVLRVELRFRAFFLK